MKNFNIVNKQFLEEINSTLIEIIHVPTNAKIIHIENEDIENAFTISFKTLPKSSNGIFHVLEHITLCGSKKYPIKDPFFSMTRRSLSTFMNAFTGPDFTCYPAASENKKDFYNLLDVYVDAIFNPLLNKYSFLQEGHRLEFNNGNKELEFKGVVYNEMKGAKSSIHDRLYHEIMKNLTPDLTYRFDSGGDPDEIINLTYEELVEAHRKNYHPSNCIFYFYGNISTKKHLKFLEENIFSKYSKKIAINEESIKQKRFQKEKNVEAHYPETKDSNTTDIIAFSYLTCDIKNQSDLYALTLIDLILSETDANPLSYNLMNSGICSEVDTLLDTDISEIPYTIICRGVQKENIDKLHEIVIDTLKTFTKDPSFDSYLKAALQQLEFSRMEISPGSLPYGIELFMRAGIAHQHGVKFENALKIHSIIKELKEKLKDNNYLDEIVKKYFIENKHLVKLSFSPSKTLEKEEKQKEVAILEQIKNSLTKEKKKVIIEETEALKKYQEKMEDEHLLEKLPEIKIKDISKKVKFYPLKKVEKADYLKEFTNNITYLETIFKIPNIDIEKFPYIAFFANILPEIGTTNRNYLDNLKYINEYLGDFSTSISINTSSISEHSPLPTLSFKGKALDYNKEQLFHLFKEMIKNADFTDKKRIKELILQNHLYLSHSINDLSMSYCIKQSLSHNSLSSYLSNKLHGLPYFQMLKKHANDLEGKLDEMINNLIFIQEKILKENSFDCLITTDKKNINKISIDNFYNLYQDINNKKEKEPFSLKLMEKKNINEGFITSTPVAFNCFSLKTISFNHEDSVYLTLASSLLENKILHPLIREKGGAYGSSANYSPLRGEFYFSSYRDPNISYTLDSVNKAIEEISEGNFSKRDVKEAKISIMQEIDKPLSLSKRAFFTYLLKKADITEKVLKERKEKILSAEKENIKEAFKKHIYAKKDLLTITTFGKKDLLEKENAKLKNKINIQSI